MLLIIIKQNKFQNIFARKLNRCWRYFTVRETFEAEKESDATDRGETMESDRKHFQNGYPVVCLHKEFHILH